jgi:hypothetical protein
LVEFLAHPHQSQVSKSVSSFFDEAYSPIGNFSLKDINSPSPLLDKEYDRDKVHLYLDLLVDSMPILVSLMHLLESIFCKKNEISPIFEHLQIVLLCNTPPS